MTPQELIDNFYDLSYDEQAEVYTKITMIFDKAMEHQRIEQHREKIEKVVVEDLLGGIFKLTNVHGNVYFAEYDFVGFKKYDTHGYCFWSEQRPNMKLYLPGDLDRIKERISNL